MKQLFEANAKTTFPQVICVGKNYLKHAVEMGDESLPKEPLIFLKPWSNVSVQPERVSLAIAERHRVDYELELGVLIENQGKNISKEKAMEHVGGYVIAIDFTDRDFQELSKSKGIPWLLSKCQDNFCPVSTLIPKNIDPYSIQLQLKLNNKRRQYDSPSNMHFKIDEIISYASRYFTLHKGDIILTGSPSGSEPVKPNDKISATASLPTSTLASLSFTIDN